MSVSIVTATYNSIDLLPVLVESLRNQTEQFFEWVVADGGSTDGTLEYLESLDDLNVKIVFGPDFGIYDALNKAVRVCSGDYYIVIGSDDLFYPDALERFKALAGDDVDVVTANVRCGDRLYEPREKFFKFMSDSWDYVSCHSVGCMFKKELHERFGYYSKRFPIAADQYFIKKILMGNVKIVHGGFVSGEFGSEGVSSTDILGHISETFRIQNETEKNKSIQFLLFLIRLLKNKLTGKF